jgi:class 3 adenylate cyclase
LRHKFEARCGVSAGEVVAPDDRELDEITDETLDLARQLQAGAAPGTLLLTRDALGEVANQEGFAQADQPVAGQDVRVWKAR